MAAQKVVKLEEVEGNGPDDRLSPSETQKILGTSKQPSLANEEGPKINKSEGSIGSQSKFINFWMQIYQSVNINRSFDRLMVLRVYGF